MYSLDPLDVNTTASEAHLAACHVSKAEDSTASHGIHMEGLQSQDASLQTCHQGDFQDGGCHIEDHAAEDEVDAPCASVDDLVQGARLSRQVEAQVQGVQVREHPGGRIPNGPLCDLRTPEGPQSAKRPEKVKTCDGAGEATLSRLEVSASVYCNQYRPVLYVQIHVSIIFDPSKVLHRAAEPCLARRLAIQSTTSKTYAELQSSHLGCIFIAWLLAVFQQDPSHPERAGCSQTGRNVFVSRAVTLCVGCDLGKDCVPGFIAEGCSGPGCAVPEEQCGGQQNHQGRCSSRGPS